MCNSAGSEYLSDTQEVDGSSPSTPTNMVLSSSLAKDITLSRWRPGFKSRWDYKKIFQINLDTSDFFVIFVLLKFIEKDKEVITAWT